MIDFDLDPRPTPLHFDTLREVVAALENLLETVGNPFVEERARAHLAYVQQLQSPSTEERLECYLDQTVGLGHYLGSIDGMRARLQQARSMVATSGIAWDENLMHALAADEGGEIPIEAASGLILDEVDQLRPRLLELTGREYDADVSIEAVDIDAYWSFWMDGSGDSHRLRINARNAHLTATTAKQFAIHEVMGHAFQMAGWMRLQEEEPQPWPRYTCIHTSEQIVLEGIAQGLPLFLDPDDHLLRRRVVIDHARQLVLGQAHIRANASDNVGAAAFIRDELPWVTDLAAQRAVLDRTRDPLLRAYLWAYPVGIDLVVRLWESADSNITTGFMASAYQGPIQGAYLLSLLA